MKRISIIIMVTVAALVLAVSCVVSLELPRCLVTFVFNNGRENLVEFVTKGDKVSAPSVSDSEGSTFLEWEKNGVKYDFDSAVDEDMTLVAVWSARTCTVTFVFNNGSDSKVNTVIRGEKVSAPSDVPLKEGYSFAGWKKGDIAYDFNSAVTEDITLEAEWTTKICSVSFDVPDDCTNPPADESIAYGKKASEPYPVPKRTGYAFDGWYLDGEEYDFSKEVYDDISLTAQWTEQYWVVSFDLNPSSQTIPSLSIRDGGTINFTGDWKPKDLEWFKFEYWTNNGEYFSLSSIIRDDVSLKAEWTPYYNVTFDLTGVSGTVESQKILKDECALKPDNPESSSKYKTFSYWSEDEDGTTEFNFTKNKITAPITLYPVWEDKFTVGKEGPAGGIIIYDVDADNASNNEDGLMSSVCGWRYLEVAPTDALEDPCKFGSDGEYTTGEKKGDGLSNTKTLLTAKGEDSVDFPAAQTFNDYKCKEFMDWYLPSRDELNLMFKYKDKIGNMKEDNYWTSTTYGLLEAYYRSFKDANDNSHRLRTDLCRVRLIHQY